MKDLEKLCKSERNEFLYKKWIAERQPEIQDKIKFKNEQTYKDLKIENKEKRETNHKKYFLRADWIKEWQLDLSKDKDKDKFISIFSCINALYTHASPTYDRHGYGRSSIETTLIGYENKMISQRVLKELFKNYIQLFDEQRPNIKTVHLEGLQYLRVHKNNWLNYEIAALETFKKSIKDIIVTNSKELKKLKKKLKNSKNSLVKANKLQDANKLESKISDYLNGYKTKSFWKDGLGIGNAMLHKKVGVLRYDCEVKLKEIRGKIDITDTLEYKNKEQERKPKTKLNFIENEAFPKPKNLPEGNLRKAQFENIKYIHENLKKLLPKEVGNNLFHWANLGFLVFKHPAGKVCTAKNSAKALTSFKNTYTKFCAEQIDVRNSFGFLEPTIADWEDGYLRISPGLMTPINVYALAHSLAQLHKKKVEIKQEEFLESAKNVLPWKAHMEAVLTLGLKIIQELEENGKNSKEPRLTKRLIASLSNNICRGYYLLTDKNYYLMGCGAVVKTIGAICQTSHIAKVFVNGNKSISADLPKNVFTVHSGLQAGLVCSLGPLQNGKNKKPPAYQIENSHSAYFEYAQNGVIQQLSKKGNSEAFYFLTLGLLSDPAKNKELTEALTLDDLMKKIEKIDKTILLDITSVKDLKGSLSKIIKSKKWEKTPMAVFYSLAKFSQNGQDKYQGGKIIVNDKYISKYKKNYKLMKDLHNEAWDDQKELYFEMMKTMGIFNADDTFYKNSIQQ